VTGPQHLAHAVERRPMDSPDGRSGSSLERVRLADGTALVLKRTRPDQDLLTRLTGRGDRELALYRSGALDRLPPGVQHTILDAWRDDGDILVLMRDVGPAVPGWTRRIDRCESRRILEAAAAVHAGFRGAATAGLCPLALRLGLFSPHRMTPLVRGPNPLPGLVVRGWQHFTQLAPPGVADAVAALHTDPTPLLHALAGYPHTLIHGDLWLVNLALEPRHVTLLDWSLAIWAPPLVELAAFLAGNAAHVHATREDILDDYHAAAGNWQDLAGLRLALIVGLLESGWNKALDACEHPEATTRAAAQAELHWWLRATTHELTNLVPHHTHR
jgi:hypothetical protein